MISSGKRFCTPSARAQAKGNGRERTLLQVSMECTRFKRGLLGPILVRLQSTHPGLSRSSTLSRTRPSFKLSHTPLLHGMEQQDQDLLTRQASMLGCRQGPSDNPGLHQCHAT